METFFEGALHSLIYHQLRKVQVIWRQKRILYKIKAFGRNIKKTTLARYFIKIASRPSFMRFRVVRRINRVHKIPKWKICFKDSVLSPSYLNLLEVNNWKSVFICYKKCYNIPFFNIKDKFYKNSFFPPTIIERNSLDSNFRNSENFGIFKNNIFETIWPKPNSFLNCCNLKGIRLTTRLRPELSHLSEHKFNNKFQNCLNPLLSCGLSIEWTSHFFFTVLYI